MSHLGGAVAKHGKRARSYARDTTTLVPGLGSELMLYRWLRVRQSRLVATDCASMCYCTAGSMDSPCPMCGYTSVAQMIVSYY
jgi:hypothetical protein